MADEADSPRVVLRDGSVATIRPTGPDDRDAIRAMFHDLSPASRYRRFFSVGEPPDAVLDRFCDSANPARSFTLGAHRQVEGNTHVIAIGSYFAIGPHIAEVAFAVDDRFHGKGLGTTLLERLAHVAVANVMGCVRECQKFC